MDDVSLAVRPGEIVGLLGPNGAGKTTTLRMLAGILSPDRGHVHVDGLDVHAAPIAAKRRIGFLSGDTQLYQRLTPREVLAYFGQLYELDPAVIAARGQRLIAELDMARLRRPAVRHACRRGRNSAPTSPARSCTIRRCSSSTSRPTPSTWSAASSSCRPSARPATPAGPCSSPRTSWARPSTSAIGSSSSTRAGSSMPARCPTCWCGRGKPTSPTRSSTTPAPALRADGLTAMRLSIVRTILVKELRETLRDRRTLLLTRGSAGAALSAGDPGLHPDRRVGRGRHRGRPLGGGRVGHAPGAGRACPRGRRRPHAPALGRGPGPRARRGDRRPAVAGRAPPRTGAMPGPRRRPSGSRPGPGDRARERRARRRPRRRRHPRGARP